MVASKIMMTFSGPGNSPIPKIALTPYLLLVYFHCLELLNSTGLIILSLILSYLAALYMLL